MIVIPFNPAAWYWLAADGRVFSSASDATVTTSDAGYAAFVARGGTATVWPNDATGAQTSAALYDVLQPYGLGGALAPAPTQAQLVAYAYAKQGTLQNGGISVNIGSSSTPDVINISTTGTALGLTTGAVQIPSLATVLNETAPSSYLWINDILPNGQPGAQITFSATQIAQVQYAIATYIQATFVTLGAVLNAIVAGTITTTAEIDMPPSPMSWPVTSY